MLGFSLENISPGDTRRVMQMAHDVPRGSPGLWGCCTRGSWSVAGAQAPGRVRSAGWCRACLSVLMEERLCQREIRKPDQVLGH